jgi:hypothetical protein
MGKVIVRGYIGEIRLEERGYYWKNDYGQNDAPFYGENTREVTRAVLGYWPEDGEAFPCLKSRADVIKLLGHLDSQVRYDPV